MNATGCVTALGDGGEAFVVLMPDEDCCGGRRRPPQTPCLAGGPPTPAAPSPTADTLTDAYKSRPLRKDRGAFVVLPEPPPPPAFIVCNNNNSSSSAAAAATATAASCSGRVSPFRGHGFKTPETGRSRASSPRSASPLKRQSSEPRMGTGRRRPAGAIDRQRLSASTKDLSVTGKPPLAPTATAKAKTSPRRKKSPTVAPPAPRPKTPSPKPKSPLPSRSPKTPKRPGPTVRTVGAAKASTKPAVANNRAQPSVVKSSSQRSPAPNKTVHANAVQTAKSNERPPPQTPVPKDDGSQPRLQDERPAVDETTTAVTAESARVTRPTKSEATEPPAPAATRTAVVVTTFVQTATVTASTSATAIATTHATNAVALPVVSGGPLVTAAPPPAAIAANTLATLSVVEPPVAASAVSTTTNPKPPQSAMRSRQPPTAAATRAKAKVIVVNDAGPRVAKAPATTTPPLSYELQEIVVEPETENLSGRNAATRSVAGRNGKKAATFAVSTNNHSSNNGHKTVAWARQSDKIIVSEERPMNAAATDDRPHKRWATAWKRRPRLCGRCCRRKRLKTGRPTGGAQTKAARADDDVRKQWWSTCCGAYAKRRIKLASSRSADGSGSIGALGIAPPTVPPAETFLGRLKRQLCSCCCCCCCCDIVPKTVRRVCRCCSGARTSSAAGGTDRPDAPKTSTPFKCSGCCMNIPKLDAVYVDHSSVMKGAIPVLPVTLAWLCLVFNVIFPGSGTFSSGILCLCVGKPRFTVNDNVQSRVGAFFVNFVVAAAQLFTVLFCLVGWGWSIWWGVIMLKMAKKYQKVKVIDPPREEPITVDHNHQV